MSQFPQHPQQRANRWELGYQTADAPVFNFFNVVYAWMAVGLAVTAVVGYLVSSSPVLLQTMFGFGVAGVLVLALGLFGLGWYVQANIGRLSTGVATSLFMLYAAIMGAMISYIFLIYSPTTLISAFALTGGVFAIMSVYGFVTKRDLTRIGSIAVMAVLGLFVASLINIFLGSAPLGWLITYAVVVLFVVITAYETQKLKEIAMQLHHQPQLAARVAIVGSLILYISFMNLFLSILRIMGSRR